MFTDAEYEWCWSWNSNTLATWCEELRHWKRPWCWERLKAGEGDDRRWDGWMASPTQWTWVWVNSGSWWWTGRPGVLQFMGSQSQTRLSDWTELNWMSTVVSCPNIPRKPWSIKNKKFHCTKAHIKVITDILRMQYTKESWILKEIHAYQQAKFLMIIDGIEAIIL